MVEKTIALFLAVAALVGRPCSGFLGRTLTTQHRPIALRRAAPCMSIAVFGATGATGSEVAYQAIKSGTAVTCLCRDPSRLVVPQGSGGNEEGEAQQSSLEVHGSLHGEDGGSAEAESDRRGGLYAILAGKTSLNPIFRRFRLACAADRRGVGPRRGRPEAPAQARAHAARRGSFQRVERRSSP